MCVFFSVCVSLRLEGLRGFQDAVCNFFPLCAALVTQLTQIMSFFRRKKIKHS